MGAQFREDIRQIMTGAIILAAGKGERMGNVDKAFLSLGPKPMVAYSLLAFENCPEIIHIVLVVRRERVEAAKGLAKMFGISKLLRIVPGGARRQASVAAGLAALPPETATVVIHDAARPLVTSELVSLCVASARKNGSGIAARKVVDTVKECDRSMRVARTVNRDRLWAAETPQAFSAETIRRAIAQANADKAVVTDDAEAVERLGEAVHLVEWKQPNLKVTVVEDMQVAAALLTRG